VRPGERRLLSVIFYRNDFGSRVRRKLSAIIHNLYLDTNPDHRACVFILGSGRSGTTWVAEVVNHDNAYRFVAEPFERGQVPISAGFSPLQYLRPDDERPEFLAPARAIFEGRVRSAWTDIINRRVIANRRLVKDVRSMLMCAWIARHFPGMPIVYVMRHPCAVAHSRMSHHWRPRPRHVYFSQPQLMEDHLAPFADLIEKPKPDFEEHVTDWCIENYVPMRQLQPGMVLLTFYERARADAEREFARIFRHFGRPLDARAVSRAGRPSVTTYLVADKQSHEASVTKDTWSSMHAESEIQGALAIVKRFGLDRFYRADAMPAPDAGHEFDLAQ
jgi:hypothetical protein